MDLAKLIDFLHQYPVWYRSTLVLWLIVGAVLAGGLIVLRLDSHPAQSPEAAVISPEVRAPLTQVPTLIASSAAAPVVMSVEV